MASESTLIEIQQAIDNCTVFCGYRILRLDEPYGYKPGVYCECINCHNRKRIRYSNLKNGYTHPCKCVTGDTSRDKRVYTDYIGIEYNGWKILDVEKFNNSYKEGFITRKCLKCGYVEKVKAYNMLTRIDDGKNLQECSNCKKINNYIAVHNKAVEKHNNLEQVLVNKYKSCIGTKFNHDRCLNIKRDPKNKMALAEVECEICGRIRDVVASDFLDKNARGIAQCECIASGWNKYSSLIGKTVFNDLILDYMYTKSGKGYNRYFLVRCIHCGEERHIENVSAVASNAEIKMRPKNMGYKMCNCNPGTRSENVLDRYTKYIGQKIEGTKLTVVGLEIVTDSNGKARVMARTVCDCSPDKENLQWLPAILMGHTTSCGCNLLQVMALNSNYYSKEFIGTTYDDLEVLDIRQTDTGGILWKCKCTLCSKEEWINPKLVVERKWHIGCGCKIQSAFERNNKYTHENLIGQDFGGGEILEIYRTEGGVTKWKLVCPFCKTEYIANATSVAAGQTRSCGCIKKSLGEKLVKQILEELNVTYKEQVSPPDIGSIMGGSLFFDFVIKHKNQIAVIEYDGEQHYSLDAFTFKRDPIENEEYFWRLQENDKIKNKYCNQHEYPLLRIRDGQYHGDYNAIKNLIIAFLKTIDNKK